MYISNRERALYVTLPVLSIICGLMLTIDTVSHTVQTDMCILFQWCKQGTTGPCVAMEMDHKAQALVWSWVSNFFIFVTSTDARMWHSQAFNC